MSSLGAASVFAAAPFGAAAALSSDFAGGVGAVSGPPPQSGNSPAFFADIALGLSSASA